MTIDPRVLRFWYETEVLAMPRAPRPGARALPRSPADQRGQDPAYRALTAGEELPWPVEVVVDERETRWVAHHYVYLGIFRHDGAGSELLRLLRAEEDDPDRAELGGPAEARRGLGEGCLAGFAVDHRGTPVATSFVLASLPWALGRLEARRSLHGFQAASKRAAAAFAKRWPEKVVVDDGEEGSGAGSGEERPAPCMQPGDLRDEVDAIVREIGWTPSEHPSGWIAIVRRTWRYESTDRADDDVFNSFHLDDLERLQTELEKGGAGAGRALTAFLSLPGGAEAEGRTDIWRDAEAMARAVRPEIVPPARWPAPGLPPQALMQQAGIDLAIGRLFRQGGLFSINGPPGTGKTTLLRDVIAALVTARARRMAALERPEDGFLPGPRITTSGQARPTWRVRPELRGFEMVVASSINGAVENVTREIPVASAIDESFLSRLDYFGAVATSLDAAPGSAGTPSWGLVAAVLGNLRNRRRFVDRVWFREPTLREALTAEEQPSWDDAREAFRAALDRERAHRERAVAASRSGPAEDGFWSRPEDERQRASPWITEEHDRCRADVFVAAMALHRAFAAARPLRDDLWMAINVIGGRLDPESNPALRDVVADLWAAFFLVVPVVSTTFASFAKLFRGMGRESLGWLFVDEAGQTPPAHAVGALWRARRALVIGDPRQIPPVTTLPDAVYDRLRDRSSVGAAWDPRAVSAQVLADRANPIGTQLADGTWMGCPLRVHRRCASPMFEISNAVAYDGLMVSATPERPSPVGEVLGPTRWIDVRGTMAEENWVEAEGEELLTLLDPVLHEAVAHGRRPDVFVISPFRSAAERARRALRQRLREIAGARPVPALAGWLESGVGTIHTFQGKETEAVVLVLGGNPGRPRARRWAGETPNILNVAVTRAQLRLYVIGDRAAWSRAGFFAELARRLDTSPAQSGQSLLRLL